MCKFNVDEIAHSEHSVEQRITLPKISLRCILDNTMKNFDDFKNKHKSVWSLV